MDGWTNAWIDGRNERRMDKMPCILQDIIPLVRCPALNFCNQIIKKSRARVLLILIALGRLVLPGLSLTANIADNIARWTSYIYSGCSILKITTFVFSDYLNRPLENTQGAHGVCTPGTVLQQTWGGSRKVHRTDV